MTGKLSLLRIERDGHFRGGEPHKPWVALIGGPCRKFGLERSFVEPMNDWRNASQAWSGNVYGIQTTFPLRAGNVYEVCRTRGKPSKRRVVREFVRVDEDGKRHRIDGDEVLDFVERQVGAPAVNLDVVDDPENFVARIPGLGMPDACAFRLDDGDRRYRGRPGNLYQVRGSRRVRKPFVRVEPDCSLAELTQAEALQWLLQRS